MLVSRSHNYSSFFTFTNSFYSLNERIKEITNRQQENLSEAEVIDLKWAFAISRWRLLSVFGVKDHLKELPEQIMQQFLSTISEKKDVLMYMDDYISLLDRPHLINFLKQNEAVIESRIAAFLDLKNDPTMESFYSKEGKLLFKEAFYSAEFILRNILDCFIGSFGLNDLNPDRQLTNNKYMARERLKFYKNLFSIPASFFQFFALYLKSPIALTLAASVSLSIPLITYVYKKYFKECPRNVVFLDNFREKRIEPVYPRQQFLQRIETAFSSGKGVLVVGESGVGKTFLVHSFIQEVLAGRSCKFIKNPEVFGCSASSFVSYKNELSFEYLKNTFQKHNDQVIFFFDEFASFFQENGLSISLQNSLKTFSEEYKYTIGATTQKEYEEFIEGNETITKDSRRFEVIKLSAMEGEELEMALDYQLRHKQPGIEVEKDVLSYIAKKAKVHKAAAILELAIRQITDLSFDESDIELSKLKQKQAFLAIKLQRSTGDCSKENIEYRNVLTKINQIENNQEKKRREFEKIKSLELEYERIKKRRFQLVYHEMDKKAKELWLKNEAVVKILQTHIQKRRQNIGLLFSLNKELINSLIETRSIV